VAWGLTTFFHPNVSTTSHASFFKVLRKGLTTIQRPVRTIAHDPCGIAFSYRKIAKKMFDKKSCTRGLMVSRIAFSGQQNLEYATTGRHGTLSRVSQETWENLFSGHQNG
jgi:hypothetical protein